MTSLRKGPGGHVGDADLTTDEQIVPDEDPTYVVDVAPEELSPDDVVPDESAPPVNKRALSISPVRPAHPRLVKRSANTRVAEPLQPVATQPPVGMATDAQLDGFRELRTRLLAMAHGLGLEHFTTLIVPLVSGSGASFIARNLAAAFTLQDRRTAMLVDCNMNHPTQHVALRTSSDTGLFDFLDEPYRPVDHLVHPTGIPGLHLIPAGRARSRFHEYFSSPAMRSVMAALAEAQYYVFLDGPTTKGSPDARILSDMADFVILVVGYGKGTPEEVAQAAAMFDPAKFAGVVFNERD